MKESEEKIAAGPYLRLMRTNAKDECACDVPVSACALRYSCRPDRDGSAVKILAGCDAYSVMLSRDNEKIDVLALCARSFEEFWLKAEIYGCVFGGRAANADEAARRIVELEDENRRLTAELKRLLDAFGEFSRAVDAGRPA